MEDQVPLRLKQETDGGRPLSSYEITLQIHKESTEKAEIVTLENEDGIDGNDVTITSLDEEIHQQSEKIEEVESTVTDEIVVEDDNTKATGDKSDSSSSSSDEDVEDKTPYETEDSTNMHDAALDASSATDQEHEQYSETQASDSVTVEEENIKATGDKSNSSSSSSDEDVEVETPSETKDATELPNAALDPSSGSDQQHEQYSETQALDNVVDEYSHQLEETDDRPDDTNIEESAPDESEIAQDNEPPALLSDDTVPAPPSTDDMFMPASQDSSILAAQSSKYEDTTSPTVLEHTDLSKAQDEEPSDFDAHTEEVPLVLSTECHSPVTENIEVPSDPQLQKKDLHLSTDDEFSTPNSSNVQLTQPTASDPQPSLAMPSQIDVPDSESTTTYQDSLPTADQEPPPPASPKQELPPVSPQEELPPPASPEQDLPPPLSPQDDLTPPSTPQQEVTQEEEVPPTAFPSTELPDEVHSAIISQDETMVSLSPPDPLKSPEESHANEETEESITTMAVVETPVDTSEIIPATTVEADVEKTTKVDNDDDDDKRKSSSSSSSEEAQENQQEENAENKEPTNTEKTEVSQTTEPEKPQQETGDDDAKEKQMVTAEIEQTSDSPKEETKQESAEESEAKRSGSAMTPDTELADVPLEEPPKTDKASPTEEPIEAPDKTKKGCCVIL